MIAAVPSQREMDPGAPGETEKKRKKFGSSTFSVVHCGGDVEFTDGEVEHGD